MKEVEKILKALSDGMKSLAKGVEAIAERVDALAKEQTAQASPVRTSTKTAAKKTVAKKALPARGKASSATDQVYQIIRRSQKGVNTATLKKKTGFNDKKIHNVIYRLKKGRKIRSIDKGVYKKA